MAIDTRTKRASAIFIASPWRSVLPAPDGTIAAGDRATTALMYSGLDYTPAPAEVTASSFVALHGAEDEVLHGASDVELRK